MKFQRPPIETTTSKWIDCEKVRVYTTWWLSCSSNNYYLNNDDIMMVVCNNSGSLVVLSPLSLSFCKMALWSNIHSLLAVLVVVVMIASSDLNNRRLVGMVLLVVF